jgi:hypothetical protein
MPVVPASREAAVGGLQFEASLGKKLSVRPYLKNKLKSKRAGWLMPVILATQEAAIRRIEV